jgi:hypothetical protein
VVDVRECIAVERGPNRGIDVARWNRCSAAEQLDEVVEHRIAGGGGQMREHVESDVPIGA